jgi:GAF domain-containing protein
MIEVKETYPASKPEMYELLKKQLAALMEGETHPLSHLSNMAALLNGALQDINWVGFYLMTDGDLLLGPFQGKPACIRIPVGKGVCGTAVAHNKTQLVEDVHQFPGHIACDGASNSEIVIPIRVNGTIVGVLDIDSPLFSRFDMQDQKGLEEMVIMLAGGCRW